MAELKLFITDASSNSREMQLTSSASIGRAVDNTIQLDDASVGRYHATIELRSGGVWLNDLGSTNGTAVNGGRIGTAYPLQSGDRITIGNATTIQVIEIAQQEPSAFHPAVHVRPPVAYVSAPAVSRSDDKLPPAYWVLGGVVVLLVLTVTGAVINRMVKPKPPSSYHESSLIPSLEKTSAAPVPPAATPTPTINVAPVDNTPTLVRDLAIQLTGKSRNYYRFDPAMIAEIRKLTSEYRVDVTRQAQEAKPDIVRAFSTAHGLKPLFGFILAMSQSKFQPSNGGQEVGYWRVPFATALEYEPGANLASLNQPEQAANLAAQCWRDARSVFTADEDFMYVIACFGMPRAKAGELHAALEKVSDEDRRDFWKMVKEKIISPEGTERVIRFFAAGIVVENPSAFRLPDAKPFLD